MGIHQQALLDLSRFAPYGVEFWLHHVRRYQFAASFLRPSDCVLDVCCGGGYGTQLMREIATSVKGIDKNKDALDFARVRYPGCLFEEQDIVNYSTSQVRYDVITMFECLDHLQRESGIEALRGVSQLCRNMMLLSLPQDHKIGVNDYHVTDWTEGELKQELEKYFDRVMLFGQSWASGQIYFPYEERRSFTVFVAMKQAG